MEEVFELIRKLSKLTYQYQKTDTLIEMEKDLDTNSKIQTGPNKRKAKKAQTKRI